MPDKTGSEENKVRQENPKIYPLANLLARKIFASAWKVQKFVNLRYLLKMSKPEALLLFWSFKVMIYAVFF